MIVDRYSGLDGSGGARRRLVTDNELVQDAVATSRGRVDVDKVRRRLPGGEAMTDGGHVGDAREVDERRGEPHRRGRESDTRTL